MPVEHISFLPAPFLSLTNTRQDLKEKLECSNGIHKETIWHQIRIGRLSGDKQNVFRIVQMKFRGNILCSKKELAACIVDGTHAIKTWINETKHLPRHVKNLSLWLLFARRRSRLLILMSR